MGLASEIARMIETALNNVRLPAGQVSGQLPGATLPPGGLSGSGYPPEDHTHPLNDLTQSGATTGQIVTWNGSAWVADDPVGGVPADGRLTLESGVPVSTTDQTAKTMLYYTPHAGNQIGLYDGSGWNIRTFSELSIAVPATTNTIYDVFVYDNAGAATLELTAWTNDTTRATALAYQNGVLVKSGATTRRYVGSMRTTGSSGQTEDSVLRRLVWNYYHRVMRRLFRQEATPSWTYNSTTIRQSNNNADNQIDLICGVREDAIDLQFQQLVSTSSASVGAQIGIGVNTTTVDSSIAGYTRTTELITCVAKLQEMPRAGYSYYAALEYMAASATGTYIGGAGFYGLFGMWQT